jgi:hypothetical protein
MLLSKSPCYFLKLRWKNHHSDLDFNETTPNQKEIETAINRAETVAHN